MKCDVYACIYKVQIVVIFFGYFKKSLGIICTGKYSKNKTTIQLQVPQEKAKNVFCDNFKD